MTQPAVSHAIRELEEETGIVLFDRLSKKVFLNQAGKVFLEKVNQLLELYRDLENGFRDLEKQAVLRIGSSITIANFWLPAFSRRFRQTCPEITLKIHVENAAAILQDLQANSIDLAFVEGVIPQRNVRSFAFSSYRVIAACSPGYSSAPSLSAADLCRERLLLREKGSAIRDVLDSTLLLRDLSADPVWTSVNSQALIQAARHGLGIAVLPELLLEHELAAGTLRPVNIDGLELVNRNHLVVHKEKFLTGPMRTFMEIVLGEEWTP